MLFHTSLQGSPPRQRTACAPFSAISGRSEAGIFQALDLPLKIPAACSPPLQAAPARKRPRQRKDASQRPVPARHIPDKWNFPYPRASSHSSKLTPFQTDSPSHPQASDTHKVHPQMHLPFLRSLLTARAVLLTVLPPLSSQRPSKTDPPMPICPPPRFLNAPAVFLFLPLFSPCLILVESPESFSYDLTAVGDRDKGSRFRFMDKISKLYCLRTFHDSQYDRFFFMCVCALRMIDRCAAL